MKNVLPVICLLIMLCIGCSKQKQGCMAVKPETEEPQILAFIAADSIHAARHSSGIYYEIINPGAGTSPSQKSNVTVTYTGKLLNGTIIDQKTTPYAADLAGVIEGWQIGIPLIKKGGRIKLIIPSAYGYGCNGSGAIPPNSVLYYDVSLVSIQ